MKVVNLTGFTVLHFTLWLSFKFWVWLFYVRFMFIYEYDIGNLTSWTVFLIIPVSYMLFYFTVKSCLSLWYNWFSTLKFVCCPSVSTENQSQTIANPWLLSVSSESRCVCVRDLLVVFCVWDKDQRMVWATSSNLWIRVLEYETRENGNGGLMYGSEIFWIPVNYVRVDCHRFWRCLLCVIGFYVTTVYRR